MLRIMIILFAFMFVFFLETPVYAYLDPGTGSYIIQLLIAGVAAVLFSIKIFWFKIKYFFGKIFHKGNNE